MEVGSSGLGVGPEGATPSEREEGQAGAEGKKVAGKEIQRSSEGGRRCGVPGLTSIVTIRLRPVAAPSRKKHRTRRPTKRMKGMDIVIIRSCPGGSGQKPEVGSSGEEGKTEASISRRPQISRSREVEVSSVKGPTLSLRAPAGEAGWP